MQCDDGVNWAASNAPAALPPDQHPVDKVKTQRPSAGAESRFDSVCQHAESHWMCRSCSTLSRAQLAPRLSSWRLVGLALLQVRLLIDAVPLKGLPLRQLLLLEFVRERALVLHK